MPYPFAAAADHGTSVEIFHGNHNAIETRSPITSFVPYTVGNQPHIIGGYTCTPLVKFPISDLKAGDKVFAGTFGDAMTFKLGPEDLEKAKTHSGVEAFEPMKGRPMKEWVLVPLAHATRWPDLAERAFSYVT